MRKRKMQPHIVLPNGQWRFISKKRKMTGRQAADYLIARGKSPKRAKAKMRALRLQQILLNLGRKHKRKQHGGFTVARRRVSHRRGGGFGGRGMMSGIIKPKGLIAAIILGAGAATLAEKILPPVIPYQSAAVGFAVGGVGGAVGALARDMLKGGISTTISNIGGY